MSEAPPPPMFPPGRVFHVTEAEGSPGTSQEYQVAEVPKTFFDEIILSSRMLADHIPNHIEKVFDSLHAFTPSDGNFQVVTTEPTIDAEETAVTEPKEECFIDTTVNEIDSDQ